MSTLARVEYTCSLIAFYILLKTTFRIHVTQTLKQSENINAQSALMSNFKNMWSGLKITTDHHCGEDIF